MRLDGVTIVFGAKQTLTQRKDTHMTHLLDLTVAAHGGLDRFNQLKTLSVHDRVSGRLWALKGQEGALDNTRLTVDLHREHVSYVPFKLANQRTDFTPQRVAVETTEGEVVEERTNPRAAFAGHTLQTPWDTLHLIYFASYAMWTYLTCPFTLTLVGSRSPSLSRGKSRVRPGGVSR